MEDRVGTPASLEESLAELQREKRVIDVLYRVGQAVAREDDLHEIVQVVTDETTAITGAQFGAFFYNVVGAGGETFSLYTISGVPREMFESFPMPRATAIFKPTFDGTAIVRLDDVLADPGYGRNPPYRGMPPGHLPVRSYLAVPVFTGDGGVVGGLFFGHEEVGVFTAEHERIAAGIATQAGTAIDKARLLSAERNARAEAEARATAALSLEYVEDGVIMVDQAGVVRLWNRAACVITGIDAREIVGLTLGAGIAGWERIALQVPVGERDQPSRPTTLPLDVRDREIWVSIYGVAFDEGTVYAFRDLTHERRLEEMRADMIATVSHELRTPVAAVYGAAETLTRGELPPETSKLLLGIVRQESLRLTTLVDEILLTSQLDSGQVVVERLEVDPREIVEAVVRNASVATQVPIEVDVPDAVPTIVADRDKAGQVLSNLVENAIKYGANGDAKIVVRLRDVRRGVRFEVADSGPGLPRAERHRVFEKFYRLDPQMTKGVRGTGLGLYISRELVLRMQGAIGVESEDGAGATFWFELPRAGAA